MSHTVTIGQRFGRWRVLRPSSKRPRYFLRECDCGGKKEVAKRSLVRGDSTSCGCYRQEILDARKVDRVENGVIIRRCSACKVEKPRTSEFFHRSKANRGGFEYSCKPCRAAERFAKYQSTLKAPPQPLIGLEGEVWRKIDGYNMAYEVSNLGRVARPHSVLGMHLVNQHDSTYPYVQLRKGDKSYMRFVHLLVAEAFIGPRPLGMECNHKDGDRSNPKPDNLEWVTPKENMQHAVKHGLISRAATRRTRLTFEEVSEIRASDESISALSRRFKIARASIRLAKNGSTYRDWQ